MTEEVHELSIAFRLSRYEGDYQEVNLIKEHVQDMCNILMKSHWKRNDQRLRRTSRVSYFVWIGGQAIGISQTDRL